MKHKIYYDLNIQIWQTSHGTILYSVISEDEQGETETVAYGDVDDVGTAVRFAREAVMENLV
jgi:hypothetical protein